MKTMRIELEIQRDGKVFVVVQHREAHTIIDEYKWANVERVEITFPKGWPIKEQMEVRRT